MLPVVALRPAPFGALAYHSGNRTLTFLKTPALVAVVRGLGEHADVGLALVGVGVGVPESQHDAFWRALACLAAVDMIGPGWRSEGARG